MLFEISVVICSHNPRVDYLARMLGALQAQTLPSSDWELLFVDNASSSRLEDICDLSWHPNARYIRAGYGAYPNAGRNTEAIRPINNLDVSLMKRFNITERVQLQIAGQALNLFNHPQYIPGTVDQAQLPNNYDIYTPGVKSYVTTGSPTFNNPVATFSSNPRTMSIAAKLTW